MKCIFLDFDGVLNNWHHFDGVALENVEVLKKIITITNARIVATSSNKYSFQCNNIDYYESRFYKKYVDALSKYGIEIYDLTPFANFDRTLEIKKYIEDNHISEYVIIDDELIGEELQEHQVFLDLYQGLKEEHINPTIDILNGKLGFYPQNYNRKETNEQLIHRINNYYRK